MTCLHNHDQILEFLRKIFLKGFQIYQNYLCALTNKVIRSKLDNSCFLLYLSSNKTCVFYLFSRLLRSLRPPSSRPHPRNPSRRPPRGAWGLPPHADSCPWVIPPPSSSSRHRCPCPSPRLSPGWGRWGRVRRRRRERGAVGVAVPTGHSTPPSSPSHLWGHPVVKWNPSLVRKFLVQGCKFSRFLRNSRFFSAKNVFRNFCAMSMSACGKNQVTNNMLACCTR